MRGTRLRSQTVSEVVFDFLRRQGLTRVFGNPGSTEIPMFVNLPDDFTYVLGLQEASVVGIADGYAQITGQAQLVNLHSAAGLGHALGAVYTAYRNRAPLLIVTGQQSRELLPYDPFLFNESPTEFPKPYVKWASEPARAADVPAAIAKAYFLAVQPPRGPTLVSVPLGDWDEIAAPLPERQIAGGFAPLPEALDALARKLEAAQEPVIVAGPVVDIDGAWDATVRLAERLQAKVWASPKSPRASFPERHPLFAGFLPAQQPGLMQCLKGADLVLVLGAPVFVEAGATVIGHAKLARALAARRNGYLEANAALIGPAFAGSDVPGAIVPVEGYGPGPGQGYSSKDDRVFYGVTPGTTVEFSVDFVNEFVPPPPTAQVYQARIVVLGNWVARLDERRVFIVVPPEGGVVLF